MVIYQYSLHFKVGLLASLLVLKLNKSILEAIVGSLVSNHFARQDGPKTTENQMKILVLSNGIQFANEENVFWWLDIRKGKIANHLQCQRLCPCFSFSP